MSARVDASVIDRRLAEAVEFGEWGGFALLLVDVSRPFARAFSSDDIEAIAESLGRVVRQGDLVAHLNQTTFVVLLGGLVDRDDARVVSERVYDTLALALDDFVISVGLGHLAEGPDGATHAWLMARRELENFRSSGTWSTAPLETMRVRAAR